MQSYKAFLFTFFLWAWEYTQKTAVHLNENNGNGVVQNQYSVIGGRMLYGHEMSFQGDITGSMTSLASNDSIFSTSTTSTMDKHNEGRNYHDGNGTLSSHPSTTDETFRVDISDDSSVSSYNSGSLGSNGKATHVTKDSQNGMSIAAKRQRSKSYDTSFEDLQSVGEKKEEWTRAKEKAQSKELFDESTYGRRKAEKGFKGHLNKYDMENRDRENSYDVSSEETLRKRIRELNSLGQGSDKDVIEGFRKSKRSRRRGKHEGDDEISDLNVNERLLRKVKGFNAKDRERIKKALNRMEENGKNMNVEDLEDLEDELKYQLERLQKYVNRDSDDNDSVASGTDDSAFDDEDDSSIYGGKRRREKSRSKEKTKDSMKELRSYIDQAMDGENAEIAHLLINKIEKYKNKVYKLKKRNKKEVNFVNMKFNRKLKKMLRYIPLISLVTSVILGLVLYQFWTIIPLTTVYFIVLFSFLFGTFVSYGITGKVMFKSPFKVIDFIRGKNWNVNADYSSRKRKKLMY
ncbi:Uncharacterized protein PCOAH_00015350 [Plasmodium coatneyi]|uniref:Pv-fam-d protein n=1 Tax=Plasmodium coatneyi TaxID=208452 RepID=A0A1B1DW02_9APIC|nr:Uncharacterized protein PCOAH_00015350 [Plasmodium coatneyi]ANQ06963.1 Uncharacterized protein PCOAH_00015350 [Plasmodium coatneyi]